MPGSRLAKGSLGETALALLGLDIVDIELCDSGSRRTLVQVLLKLFQRAAVTLSLTSDLSMDVSTIDIGERYTAGTNSSVIGVLDVTSDS
jgi:hypothetical protein